MTTTQGAPPTSRFVAAWEAEPVEALATAVLAARAARLGAWTDELEARLDPAAFAVVNRDALRCAVEHEDACVLLARIEAELGRRAALTRASQLGERSRLNGPRFENLPSPPPPSSSRDPRPAGWLPRLGARLGAWLVGTCGP